MSSENSIVKVVDRKIGKYQPFLVEKANGEQAWVRWLQLPTEIAEFYLKGGKIKRKYRNRSHVGRLHDPANHATLPAPGSKEPEECEDRRTGEKLVLDKYVVRGEGRVLNLQAYLLNNWFNEVRYLSDADVLLVNMKKPYYVGDEARSPPPTSYKYSVMPISDIFPVLRAEHTNTFNCVYKNELYAVAHLLNEQNTGPYEHAGGDTYEPVEEPDDQIVNQTLNYLWSVATPLHGFKHGQGFDEQNICMKEVLMNHANGLLDRAGLSEDLLLALCRVFQHTIGPFYVFNTNYFWDYPSRLDDRKRRLFQTLQDTPIKRSRFLI